MNTGFAVKPDRSFHRLATLDFFSDDERCRSRPHPLSRII
jgi:hypothetical protein